MGKHKNIPIEFYNEREAGIGHPVVHTVGELIAQLQRLPSSLPISGGWGNPAELVVYNISEDPFLEIKEYDGP